MAARVKWRIVESGTAKVDRFLSEDDAYEHVEALRLAWADGAPGSVGAVTVQVDKGQGWETLEFVDFAEESVRG